MLSKMKEKSAWKIGTLFTIAVAVRKFQKYCSEKYMKLLSYDFNRQEALSDLKSLYVTDGQFYTTHFIRLSYLVQKFNFSFDDISFLNVDGKSHLVRQIFEFIEKCLRTVESFDQKMVVFLCCTLKMITVNSTLENMPLNLFSVVNLCKICKITLVRNELISLVMHFFIKMNAEHKTNPELLSAVLTLSHMTDEAKSYFLKLESNENAKRSSSLSSNFKESSSLAVPKVKKNQQIVSKTIQTVKAKHYSQDSEEEYFRMLNLADSLKNQNKRKHVTPNDEDHNDPEKSYDGDDRSIFRSTWPEVLNLYKIVTGGGILKDNDKNKYIPDKFLGEHHYFWPIKSSEKKIYSFFINRMCVSILLKVSKEQRLNENTLNKLMKCITNFNDLRSKLNLNEYNLDLFCDTIVKLKKKLTDPDIAHIFLRKILDKTTEEYISEGWINNSTEVKRKKFDPKEISDFLVQEINLVRIDAVKALYNCAVRKKQYVLTKDRLDKLHEFTKSPENDQKQEANKIFTNHVFELIAIAHSFENFDYKKYFEDYQNRLQDPKSLEEIEKNTIFEFMNNQVRDSSRAAELVHSREMFTFIRCLKSDSGLTSSQMELVLDTINTYLNHENTSSLSDKNYEELLEITLQNAKTGLSSIKSYLISCLLTTDKTQRLLNGHNQSEGHNLSPLTKYCKEKLIELYCASVDCEENTSIIVLIFSRVFCLETAKSKELFLDDENMVELISAKLVSSHSIIFDDNADNNDRIQFENSATVKDSCNKISLLAAKIILRSVDNKVPLTSATIDNLIFALSSENGDKQTNIIVAKCLYGLTSYMTFHDVDNLCQLLDLVNSDIYDVRIYIRMVYIRGCLKMALESLPVKLDSIHLQSMSSLFVYDESLILGKYDFKDKINGNILKVLQYEAKKQEFPDSLLLLFEFILKANEEYTSQVLAILLTYSYNYIIPETTVNSLDNLLGVSSCFESALIILENVITVTKSPVNEKTLSVFADHLQQSPNSCLRFKSFKLLEQARHNQQLPDVIFSQCELVRAGYALEQLHTKEQQEHIIEYVQKSVEKGVKLPIDTKNALGKQIEKVNVLNIFETVTRNKDIIHSKLLTSLFEMFEPLNVDKKETNLLLLKIYENAAKNNQSLQECFLKLDSALAVKELKKGVLPVFMYLVQTGEKLSMKINIEILNNLIKLDYPSLKQGLLSSLRSIIEANKSDIQFYLPKMNEIVLKEINSEHLNIQKLCLGIISSLVRISKHINDRLLIELVEIGTNADTNKTIRVKIYELFQNIITDDCNSLIIQEGLRGKIELSNLAFKSPDDLLDQLKCYNQLKCGFPPLIYRKLKELMDSESLQLQKDILDLLNVCHCNSSITDPLLDSVAMLYESTLSEELKDSCLQLIIKTSESGKILKDRALAVMISKTHKNENINAFLRGSCASGIKEEFGLSRSTLLNILKLVNESKKLNDVEKLDDLILLIIEGNVLYPRNESFVNLIEQCIFHARILDITLPIYCRLIKETQVCDSKSKCLETLVVYFTKYKQELNHLLPVMCECMYHAAKLNELPIKCVNFAESNLTNKNHLVRGYSFGIMRSMSDNDSIGISKDCFNDLLDDLDEEIRLKLQNSEDFLVLLETVVSVAYLDTEVFSKHKTIKWKRELLISDLFKFYRVLQRDQILFKEILFAIEDKFGLDQSCELLSLISKCSFTNSLQIMDVLIMIFDLPLNVTKHVLTINSPNTYYPLKQAWCSEILRKCLDTEINETYFSTLIGRLCSNFDIFFLGKLFSCLKSIDNLKVFEDIMKFCLDNNIDIKMIPKSKNIQLNPLRHVIESNFLFKCAHRQPLSDLQKQGFVQVYEALKNASWTYDQLHDIVTNFNPTIKNDFKYLLFLLNTLESYQLPPSNFDEIMNILIEFKSFKEIIQNTNNLIIENHFQQEGKAKDSTEILTELKDSNQSYNYLIDLIDSGSLNIKEKIFKQQSKFSNWNKSQINSWAQDIRHSGKKFCDYEAIAIILRANFLITGHTLTDTQILCCLIALQETQCRGKLFQVATGEGKSTIICILAIITALRGKKVDVITSSPVLAERDAKQKAQLYRIFSLTCSDNNDKTVYLRGKKSCYLADIVYGEMSQFQFDILRDNYSKLDTLAGRKFSTAIVDEVDSMLIDDSSKIARLSSSVPGMDHFHVFYVSIWQRLQTLMKRFIKFPNKWHYVKEGEVVFENGRITLELDNGDGQIVKIEDLEQYITTSGDQNRVSEAVDDIDEFLRKDLERYVENRIENNQIYIPCNFSDLIQNKKNKWITNAVEALKHQENIHYIVQEGQIKPVDYDSTGVVQSSTVWSDGLHQFLQLKHNLKITSETLTSNFLSNIGFVDKYETVYGLTGTLGSKTARKVLEEVYKVDVINIPQRRQKQFLELKTAIIKENEREWLQEIVSCIELETMKKRGILVICETIKTANRIDELLKAKFRSSSVKLYTMNDMDQEKNVDNISPGQVIIATNLAGRGTDIRTDEIEETGGLHVVLTFLPNNQRVEDQAYGRTSRQGKRGSGVMILNSETFHEFESKRNVKEERDNMEKNILHYFVDNELEFIKVKDKLFEKFCEFLNDKIRLPIRNKNNSYARKLLSKLKNILPTTYETCVLSAVEERWAKFLREIDEGNIKCANAEISSKKLLEDLERDFSNAEIIKNPYYLISIGNDILKNSPKKAKKAKEYFEKAVQLEQNRSHTKIETDKNIYCPGAAHVGISWCEILIKENNYKQHAYDCFQSAFNCLLHEMSILNTMQLILQQKQTAFADSDLDKQLKIKANILGSYIQGVESNIDAIKRSKRMIDLVSIDSSNDEVLERIEYFKDQEISDDKEGSFKNEDLKLTEDKHYNLILNHLTVHEDLFTYDQALMTLDNVCNSFKRIQSFKINLKQVDLGRVRESMFLIDKQFKDLTRDSAISKLKEERSYFNAFHITDSYLTDLHISSTDNIKMKKTIKDKQINELIDEIDKTNVNDKSIRFDILIHKANENEITKHFSNPDSNTTINALFTNMNKEIAMKKLLSVKTSKFDIDLVLHKSFLLEVIENNQFLLSGTMITSEGQLFEKLEKGKIINRLSNMNNDAPCFIKFDGLDKFQTLSIVASCPETVFNICFRNIDHGASEQWEGQVDFSFDNMDKETAKKIIPILRKHNFEFSLEFKDLNKNQVKNILMKAKFDQEEIKIMEEKYVRDLFMYDSLPELELLEFSLKGIEYILEINEKLFLPIRSICLVVGIGVGQIILGTLLQTVGGGIGMGFVTEGFADLYTAYRIFKSRKFEWKDYCVQKGVSLAISAISMGVSSIKEGAKVAEKGIKTFATGAGTEVLEQAGTKIITDKKSVDLLVKTTLKNSKVMARKFIMNDAPKLIATHVINKGVNALSTFAFDSVKPLICERIRTIVRNLVTRREHLLYLYKMRAIDLVTETSQLERRINNVVAEIVNPKNNSMHKYWNSVAVPLIKEFLSNFNECENIFNEAVKIVSTLNAIKEVFELTNKVIDSLFGKLRLFCRNTYSIHRVLSNHLKIDKDRSKLITVKLKSLGIIDDQENFSDENNVAEKLAKFSRSFQENRESLVIEFDVKPDQQESFINDIEKTIEFLLKCNDEYMKIDQTSFSRIIDSISDQIAGKLVRVIDSKLIQPISQKAADKLNDSLFKKN